MAQSKIILEIKANGKIVYKYTTCYNLIHHNLQRQDIVVNHVKMFSYYFLFVILNCTVCTCTTTPNTNLEKININYIILLVKYMQYKVNYSKKSISIYKTLKGANRTVPNVTVEYATISNFISSNVPPLISI